MKVSIEDYYLSIKAEILERENKKKIKWIKHNEVKKILGLLNKD